MYTMRRTIAPLFLVSALGLLLSGCFEKRETVTPKAVTEKPKFVVVNVLDKEVYDDCHIKGSISVPFESFKDYATKNWDKLATKIVVYCANHQCTASLEAAKMLVHDLGFEKKNVWTYEAGCAGAQHEGIPVEGPCKEDYLKEYKAGPEKDEEDGIQVISTEGLKKLLQEFAAN